MKASRPFWIQDLEQLLDETIVKDAVAEVMTQLDRAVQALPEPSRLLISRYFDGASLEELGKEHQVDARQMGEWIERIKRELSGQIRGLSRVKH